jgi:hypothetical protein
MKPIRIDDALIDKAAADARSIRTWRWVAAAALFALAATVTLWIRQSTTEMASGAISFTLLEETTRATSTPPQVDVPHGSIDIFLLFQLNFAADAFPLSLEILDYDGQTRCTRQVRTEDLNDGDYYLIPVPRRILPDGDYRARLKGSGGGPGTEYPFRVLTAPAP